MSDFFRINLPYGIKVKPDGHVAAFNREYQALGVLGTGNESDGLCFEKYREITQEKLDRLGFDHNSVSRDEKDGSVTILFYNDSSNPQSKPEYWQAYTEKMKILSSFIHISQY